MSSADALSPAVASASPDGLLRRLAGYSAVRSSAEGCAAAAAVAGHAATALRADAAAIGIYLVLILPLARGWRGEWRRLRGER